MFRRISDSDLPSRYVLIQQQNMQQLSQKHSAKHLSSESSICMLVEHK